MVEVARVRRAHGVRGELRVELLADDPAVLAPGTVLTIEAPGGARGEWIVRSLREGPGGARLLGLRGLDDRTLAEGLRDARILVAEAALPALEGDEFYFYELEGLSVVGLDGSDLGTVRGVFNAGASDVAEVAGGPPGDWMLPLVDGVVVQIDRPGRRMVVLPLEGLLEGGI